MQTEHEQTEGFTLIELIIAVAIIGVLAAIAYPSYQESVAKSKRADAQGGLLSLASAMERHFTETNSYCDAGTSVVANCGTGSGDTGAPNSNLHVNQVPMDGGTAYYNLEITSVTSSSFTVTANSTGSMASDKCGDFTFTHTGAQGVNNNTADTEDCWRQ